MLQLILPFNQSLFRIINLVHNFSFFLSLFPPPMPSSPSPSPPPSPTPRSPSPPPSPTPRSPSPPPSPPPQSATEPSLSFSSPMSTTAFLPPDADVEPESDCDSAPTILGVSFNQDFTCFAVATDSGFRIYNSDPFREIFRRTFSRAAADPSNGGGGIASVQMLFRCNILAVVGGGDRPQYPPTKVMIWDDHECRCIGELSFRSDVKSVRLRRDRIVVALLQKVFVYNFVDLKLLHQIETFPNPKGLCEISCASNSLVLGCPGMQKGQIRVEHYAIKRTKFIMAHDSRIAAMALTLDGRIIATASSKGTLVRVYNTLDATLLQEVRRGTDRAEIHSLAFSPNAQWLAVSSDRGTVHVFNLKVDSAQSPGNSVLRRTSSEPSHYTPPPVSSLSFMKGFLPKYFSSEWSVAQLHLREGTQYCVAFGHQENTIVVVGMDGSWYKCKFNPVTGGEMEQLEYHDLLKPEEPSQI